MARNLYIDLTSRQFVNGLGGGSAQIAPFWVGNSEPLNLYFLQQTGLISAPYEFLNKSSATLKVGLGAVAGEPTGGTWTLSSGGYVSASLPANASVTQIATAITNLNSISGGVSVSGSLESGYLVTFLSTGTQSLLGVSAGNLFPTTLASVTRRVTGASSVNEVQEIVLACDAASSATSFSALSTSVTASVALSVTGTTAVNAAQTLSFSQVPSAGSFTLSLAGVTIASTTSAVTAGLFTTTGNHGLAPLQPIVLNGFAGLTGVDGVTNGKTYQVYQTPSKTSFTLKDPLSLAALPIASSSTTGTPYVATLTESTAPLSYNADATAVQKALQGMAAIGTGNVQVTGLPGENFSFSFCNQKGLVSLPLLSVSSSLSAPPGFTGTLSVSAPALTDLISDFTAVPAILEVQITESGNKLTAAQGSVTLSQTLLP